MKPTYMIQTLEDMLNIPLDRQEAFLADLKVWLKLNRELKEKTQNLENIQVRTPVMKWIDDGEIGVSSVTMEFGAKQK